MDRTSRDDRGASAVEYGLLVALVASLIVVAVFALGRVVTAVFLQTCEAIVSNNAEVAAGSCNE